MIHQSEMIVLVTLYQLYHECTMLVYTTSYELPLLPDTPALATWALHRPEFVRVFNIRVEQRGRFKGNRDGAVSERIRYISIKR